MEKEEPTLNPSVSFRRDGGTKSYETFLLAVSSFRKLNALPCPILFPETSTVSDFVQNRAIWHKSCHRKFSSDKVRRVQLKKDNFESAESSSNHCFDTYSCFICGHVYCVVTHTTELKTVSFQTCNDNIHSIVNSLQDQRLQSIIAGRNLVECKAMYHDACLKQLRERSLKLSPSHFSSAVKAEEDSFNDICNHIRSSIDKKEYILPLADLYSKYMELLHASNVLKSVNRTVFKERILAYFQEAKAEENNRKLFIIFKDKATLLLEQNFGRPHDSDDDEMLNKAARLLRKYILTNHQPSSNGDFNEDCQGEFLPPKFLNFMNVLMTGSTLNLSERKASQPVLTAAQIVIYNMRADIRKRSNLEKMSYSSKREPPLPVHVGLKLHQTSRNMTLINDMHHFGLSIPYGRVLSIEKEVAPSATQRFADENAVIPGHFKENAFISACVDNIDHNPSSNSSETSFHGTSIGLFQMPTDLNPGSTPTPIICSNQTMKILP